MVKKKDSLFFLTILTVAILDQLTKYLVKNKIINISFSMNSGSLWGLFHDSALILSWLSIFIIGIFLFYFDKIQKSHILVKIGSGLIVGGAIGNLIDRFIYKAVIDFIDLKWWPSFNIADSALCVGVALLIIYFLFEDSSIISKKINKKNHR